MVDAVSADHNFNLILQGLWLYVDQESDPKVMYRGEWSRTHPESKFPDLERRYYHETLNEQFSEKEEVTKEVTKHVERRKLLKRVRFAKQRIIKDNIQ